MGTLLTRVRAISDVGFIVGFVFALLLAEKIVPLLIVFGVLPIPFLLRSIGGRALSVPLWRLLAPMSIYFAYSLGALYLFPGLDAGERRPANPGLELYLVAIAMLAVGVLRGLEIPKLQRLFNMVVPWSLTACFIYLSGLMFLGYRPECRVFAGASWPFIPAIIFTTLTYLTWIGWRNFSPSQQNFRLLLNTMSIVVVSSYTGSRGIAVAQAIVLAAFLIQSLMPRFAGMVPNWRQLAVSTLAGVVFCGGVIALTGCGPLERFVSIARTVVILADRDTAPAPVQAPAPAPAPTPGPAPSGAPQETPRPEAQAPQSITTDVAINVRLEMWKTSIAAIREAPVLGHGALYMERLIAARYGAEYEHNHNQYLSWLVTGGALALLLGLFLLATPWLVSLPLPTSDRLIVALSISVLWGVAMVFDSFFNLKFYLHYYCLLCGVLYALVNDMTKDGATESRTT